MARLRLLVTWLALTACAYSARPSTGSASAAEAPIAPVALDSSRCSTLASGRPPLITEDSVGPFALGLRLRDARAACSVARDTIIDEHVFGFLVGAYGSIVLVLTDRGLSGTAEKVDVVTVVGGDRIRTVDGIGPGMTLANASATWGALRVIGCTAGFEAAEVAARSWLALLVGPRCVAPMGWVASYPDTLVIRAIEIYRPID